MINSAIKYPDMLDQFQKMVEDFNFDDSEMTSLEIMDIMDNQPVKKATCCFTTCCGMLFNKQNLK